MARSAGSRYCCGMDADDSNLGTSKASVAIWVGGIVIDLINAYRDAPFFRDTIQRSKDP